MTRKLRFARPALAADKAAAVSGHSKWNNNADGLFLAAPRRTGKSTFLKGDLKPALEALGAEVIYLDFWSNLQVDPAEMLYAEISRTLLANAGFIAKMAERTQLARVRIGAGGSSLEFDPARVGQSAGSSLMAALRELSTVAGKPVALILDEAQHLAVSPRGEEVLKELKAARDTLNQPDDIRLMLVMSGSDRDKLSRLTNSKGAAFFGSEVEPLELLDKDYVEWLSGLLAQSSPTLGRIDTNTLHQAFKMLGHRPKLMDGAIGHGLNPVTRGDLTFEAAVLSKARSIVRAEHAGHAARFIPRSPMQKAVLTVLMDHGDDFSPYTARTLKAIEVILGKKVVSPSVQSALEALRKINPPLVWKSNRADYALDDLGMVDWYRELKARGAWPPA